MKTNVPKSKIGVIVELLVPLAIEVISSIPKKSKKSKLLKIESIDEVQLQILFNLVKIDKIVKDEEIQFINKMVSNSNILKEKKDILFDLLSDPLLKNINYSVFKNPEDKINLINNMISLAISDNKLEKNEKMYINEVGEKLGFPQDDIETLLKQNEPSLIKKILLKKLL